MYNNNRWLPAVFWILLFIISWLILYFLLFVNQVFVNFSKPGNKCIFLFLIIIDIMRFWIIFELSRGLKAKCGGFEEDRAGVGDEHY